MKTRFKKNGIPALEYDQSTTRLTKEQRKNYRINFENNKYKMSGEELIEKTKLGDFLKRMNTNQLKNIF